MNRISPVPLSTAKHRNQHQVEEPNGTDPLGKWADYVYECWNRIALIHRIHRRSHRRVRYAKFQIFAQGHRRSEKLVVVSDSVESTRSKETGAFTVEQKIGKWVSFRYGDAKI